MVNSIGFRTTLDSTYTLPKYGGNVQKEKGSHDGSYDVIAPKCKWQNGFWDTASGKTYIMITVNGQFPVTVLQITSCSAIYDAMHDSQGMSSEVRTDCTSDDIPTSRNDS